MEEELTDFDSPGEYPEPTLQEIAQSLIENAYRRLDNPPDNTYHYIATPSQMRFFRDLIKKEEVKWT